MSGNSDRGAIPCDVETVLTASTDRLNAVFKAMEDRLIESMREMQTELLRAFAAFSQTQDLRLSKLEVNQSNLDTALSSRIQILEDRLHRIELKLGGVH